MKILFPIFLVSTALACGDDSTGSASQSTGSESDPGPGESSTSGMESESDTEGNPLEGLTVSELRHVHTCVSGCGPWSDEQFLLTVTSDSPREIVVHVYDFTTEGETLVEPSEPLATESRILEAGVAYSIPLTILNPNNCRTTLKYDEKPISVLLSIDGAVFEFDGLSVGETFVEGEC